MVSWGEGGSEWVFFFLEGIGEGEEGGGDLERVLVVLVVLVVIFFDVL